MRFRALAAAGWVLVGCSSTPVVTDGGPVGATCTISGATVGEGVVNPANPCRSCQVAVSTTDWTPYPTGTFCNDPGTGAGLCNAGACEPGCYIDGAFLPPGAPNPSASCQSCAPASDTTSFSPATGLPSDGGCSAGNVCSQGACMPGCFIGGAYQAAGAYDPASAGQCCAPLSDLDGGADGGLRGGISDWTPQFGYGELLSGSNVPTVVLAGDFAGSGRNDLALFGDPNSLLVFPNLGAGIFGAPGGPYVTGINPVGAVTDDFDGDGRADLACVSQNDGLIGFFMNSGGGFLVDGGAIVSPAGAIALAVGDFDGDHHPDLVFAEGTPSIAMLRNANNGSFVFYQPTGPIDAGAVDAGDAILWQTNALVHSMAVADFNGDGKPDLVVVEQMTNQVGLFLNDGNGGFSPRTDFNVGSAPASGVAGDFDGDGKMDFAVVNTAEQPPTVGVLLNDGAGGFSPMVRYPTSAGTTAVIAGDFNGDHRTDLAVVSSAGRSSTLGVLYGLADGGFSSGAPLPTGPNLGGTAADLTGQGGIDLAAFGSRFVSLLLNACH